MQILVLTCLSLLCLMVRLHIKASGISRVVRVKSLKVFNRAKLELELLEDSLADVD